MSRGDLPNQRKPEPVAVDLRVNYVLRTIERLEYLPEIRLRNPDAMIFDGYFYSAATILCSYPQPPFSITVLNRIDDEILYSLAKGDPIGLQFRQRIQNITFDGGRGALINDNLMTSLTSA